MLRWFTNNDFFENRCALWLLVLIAALFQVPVSTNTSVPVSEDRIELIETPISSKLSKAYPFSTCFDSSHDLKTCGIEIQIVHDQLTIVSLRSADIDRIKIRDKDLKRLIPKPSGYDNEMNMTLYIG